MFRKNHRRRKYPSALVIAALLGILPACGNDPDTNTGGGGPGGGGAGGGGAMGGGGAGGGGADASDVILWTQSVDTGLTLGESNDDFADQGRESIFDPSNNRRYVIGYGLIEDTTDPSNTYVGYVRSYDATSAEVLAQLRIGPTGAGKETRLFNGVIGTDQGTDYLYVTGKTTANILAICPGGLEFPAAGTGPSLSGLVLQIDLVTFNIVDCLAIQSENDRFDEIASLEWDDQDEVLWIAGATRGTLVPGSRVAGNPEGKSDDNNDFFAARLSPSLDDAPLFIQFGSVAFDETLGTHFDSASQTLYIAGSTKGDLCATYPVQSSALGIPCQNGQNGAFGDNFDSYFASITFSPPSTITHKWIYQDGEGSGMGAEDADVAHDVALYTNMEGTHYLYETGYAPGGAAKDVRISRITLDANGNPQVTAGGVDRVRTRVADPTGFGDNGATLYIGETNLWVTASMHAGADHAHGGACGQGETSANEGHLLAFAHATFANDIAPDIDFARIVTTGNSNQHSTSFEGLSYSEGRFWIAGNTTAAPGTGYCGTQTTKDYDDETDAAIFYVEYANP